MSAYRTNGMPYAILMAITIIGAVLISGCESLPIKNGELELGKDTSATMADAGAVRINNRF